MEPRLKTSKTWTKVPKDYTNQVLEALAASFPQQTQAGEWICEGRIYQEELLLLVGYLEKGRIQQVNFEISAAYIPGRDNVPDLLNLVVDIGASLLQELFAQPDDFEFPQIWTEYIFEKRSVFVQYSGVNTKLEEQANKILGIDEPGLVQQVEDDSDFLLETIKKNLGISETRDPSKKKFH